MTATNVKELDLGPAYLPLKGVRAGDQNVMIVELLAGHDPWNTTGAAVSSQAREFPESPTIALQAEVTEIDAAAGLWQVSWPGDKVRSLLDGARKWNGYWDMQVIPAGETLPVTVLDGPFEAEMDVTRIGP